MLAKAPTWTWVIAAILFSLVLVNVPCATAAPFDPVSTELVNDQVDLENIEIITEFDIPLLIEGGGNRIVPAVPEVRRDLC